LLAACNLINYIGKQDKIEQIEIAPVILKKGETQLCLYSLGSMRDERLHRMFKNQKVRFLRPQQDIDQQNHRQTNNSDEDDEENDDTQGFFNIFMLHQNRDLGRGKNCVQETMIPEWIDLVVWGHEHECIVDLFESVVGTFRITQPGSSVATSLVAGEAARKKVGVLDIKGKQYRLTPVPLTQVRPFVTAEISLQEHREQLDPEDPRVDEHVATVLQEEVKVMVCSAQDKRRDLLREARRLGNDAGDDDSPLMYQLEKPGEPLVRLRVEHTGFSTLSNQRFGAHFVGQVANPEDILLFHRRKDPSKAAATRKAKVTSAPIAPEVLKDTDMDDIVNGILEGPETQLKLLDEKVLAEAMENFVDKKVVTSLDEAADRMLSKRQKALLTRKVDDDDDNEKADRSKQEKSNDSLVEQSMEADILVNEGRSKSQKSTRRPANTSADDSFDMTEMEDRSVMEDDSVEELTNRASNSNRHKKRGRENDDPKENGTSKRGKAKPAKGSNNGEWANSQLSFVGDAKRKAARRKALDELSDVEEVDFDAPTKSKSTRRNTRGKRVDYSIDDDDENLNSDDDPEVVSVPEDEDDDDDDDLMDDDSDSPGRGKKRRKTPAANRSRAQKPAGRKAAPAKKTSATKYRYRSTAKDKFADSDDEVSRGDVNNTMDLDEDWGTAKTRSQF
jgi:double-strand break repair protein MRE11